MDGSAGQRLVLDGVDWRGYRRLLRVFAERPGLRLTYARGRLEMRTTSPEHEWFKRLLGQFVE
jgi:hypothetical protein